jgi:hypothetical protein
MRLGISWMPSWLDAVRRHPFRIPGFLSQQTDRAASRLRRAAAGQGHFAMWCTDTGAPSA